MRLIKKEEKNIKMIRNSLHKIKREMNTKG
jgi:hypothetical protein